MIEIAPPFQDQGLGSKIIRDLQTQAQDQQKPLTLHVLKANQSARHLYERLGFVQKAEEENKYYMVWQPVPNNTM
ncbi:MAG: N-acetyltransferase [Chloroflexota bacterium]